jgi:exonuclease I
MLSFFINIKNKDMAKIKSEQELKEQLSKKESEITKEAFVKAIDIVSQQLNGIAVNKDNAKMALAIVQTQPKLLAAENKAEDVKLQRDKFKYSLIKDYGLPENKAEKERLVKLISPELKLN